MHTRSWRWRTRLALPALLGLSLFAARPLRAGTNSTAVPADFDCDGKADLARRLKNHVWVVEFMAGDRRVPYDIQRGGESADSSSQAVAGDFDGDCRADFSIKRSDGVWLIDYTGDGLGPFTAYPGYGPPSSVPVPADYDGDGKTDLSVKDPNGVWYIDYASNGFGQWNAVLPGYGPATSVPCPADYDGDGKADLSVKDANGVWYIDYASDGFGAWNEIHTAYGPGSFIPVPADYDGDGRADLSVKGDDGFWLIDYAYDGFGAWNVQFPGYGRNAFGDPVPADYDGDGKADLAIKSNDEWWYIDFAADGFGHWNSEDPLWGPKPPKVTLVEATAHSLKVKVDASGGDPQGYSGARKLVVDIEDRAGTTITVQSGLMTQTYSGLDAGTEYCVEAVSSHVERTGLPVTKCFSTADAPPPPPDNHGTVTIGLRRQPISEGPVPFLGTFGPITNARPVRIWMQDSLTDVFVHFIRAGHSTEECFGPNHDAATLTLQDGGSLGPAEIATILGSTPPAGVVISFVACLSHSGTQDFSIVFVNIDYGP